MAGVITPATPALDRRASVASRSPMHRRRTSYLLPILFVLAAVVAIAQPRQTPSDDPATDTTRRGAPPGVDTLGAERSDTLGFRPTGPTAPADSLRVSTHDASGADTVVSYSSRDSMKLSVGGKIMRLFGDAEVTKGAMHLEAAYIEIDFRKSELYARAHYDSATKQYVGVPVFKDATQEFSALSMRYNFKTGKGITEAAETRFDEGFYYGERIKRVDRNTLFIQDGIYTTCDAPHPHYFFRSDEMKVVVGDKIYVDQPTLHVADVPVFFIPIGVFFARSGGKQSGLIIPTWSQNAQRGFTIEGLGYFWAGNDYVDAKFLTDLYSKGGYAASVDARGRVRGIIDAADLYYKFGRTRDDPDEELETSHHVRYYHAQKLGRRTQLGGTLDMSTRNAIRRTSTQADRFDRIEDITTQLLTSNVSLNHGFDFGSLALQYDRTQNVITDELTQRVPISFSVPAWTPFASGGGEPGLFDNLALSGSTRATWESVRQDTLPGGGFRTNDTRRGVQISPSINLTLPKLGYFSITPSVQAQGGLFFRRTFREYGPDSVLIRRTEPQFRQAWTYGASIGMTTTLYGLVQPRIFGVNALRHVLQPTVSYSFRPDFGRPEYRYFDSVFNPRTRAFERYSVFEADASVAPAPGYGLTNAVSLSLQNIFEAKIAQGDTVEDATVRLLTLNLDASYNAAAEQFKWSNINVNANTQLGAFGSLGASLVLDPYADTNGVPIPELLVDRGEGLLRIRSGSIRFSASFSDQGFGTTVAAAPVSDSVGSRRQRFDFEPIAFHEEQFFGDEVRGAGGFRIPWTISIDGAYNVSRNTLDEFTEYASVTLGFNLGLTPTTRVTSSVTYDLLQKQIVIPTISFQKDLHCWEMNFDWRPVGFSTGFYFRLGIKSAQLRDIELERERSFVGEP